MKIELFTFTYNDEDLLPFFLKHYESLVHKMTFIDSGSTDKTLEMVKNHNVVKTGLSWWDWDALHYMRNNIWRGSQYDLIFFPDLDEFFYRPDLLDFLERSKADIYQLKGYQMVADSFPKNGSMLDIKLGIPLPLHDKYTIFKPTADIVFPDAHNITTNSKSINRFGIKLLHYKYMGAKHMAERARKVKERVPANSFTHNINGNILKVFPSYFKTEEEYKVEIAGMLARAERII